MRLDPCRNRTQLPILAGVWPVLLVGLDLSGTDTPFDRTLDPLLPARGGQIRLCAQRGQVVDWLVTIDRSGHLVSKRFVSRLVESRRSWTCHREGLSRWTRRR